MGITARFGQAGDKWPSLGWLALYLVRALDPSLRPVVVLEVSRDPA